MEKFLTLTTGSVKHRLYMLYAGFLLVFHGYIFPVIYFTVGTGFVVMAHSRWELVWWETALLSAFMAWVFISNSRDKNDTGVQGAYDAREALSAYFRVKFYRS